MKKYFIYIMALLVGIVAPSCEDQLDLNPQQNLNTGEALGDISGLETALVGGYAGLQAVSYYGRNFVVVPEVMGDNILVALDNSGRFLNEARYIFNPDNSQTALWNGGYNIIARVNNVINELENVSDGTQAQKDQILGEALFLRGLIHFDLVRIFGQPYVKGNGSELGIPIILKTEIGEPARNTVGEVYDQVIADFTQAASLLDDSNAPYLASKSGAQAMLSRVYLYKGDNDMAINMANAVINSGSFSLIPTSDYINSWGTDGSNEEIFTLVFQSNESNGADNLGQIYIPEGYGDLRPTIDIMDLLPPEDIRSQFIRVIDGDEYQYKYPGKNGIPGLASPRVIRLAEVYLNRAEAYAKKGDFANAKADLNVIRTRAGLEAADPADGQVLSEVLLERRKELAFEGHRAFDIYRNEQDLVRIECNTPNGINCTVPFTSHLIAFPIPTRELDANPNMVQSPGY